MILRNQDVISGNCDLEHLYTIKDFPVFMGCVDQPQDSDVVADVSYHISSSTGMIQLTPLLPLDVVYQAEHAPGLVGKEWLLHHKAFADFILKYRPRKVFEIGGAHGILSKNCHDVDCTIDWTILEPNPVPTKGLTAKIVKGFYTEETVLPTDVDMLVHSHTLEHVYNPGEFFRALGNISAGTKMCFAIPNLRQQLAHKYTNVINFEHTFFCTEEFVEWWLATNGFDILEKQIYKDDHSIFYATVRSRRDAEITPPPNSYEQNLQLFGEYIAYHTDAIRELNHKIKDMKNPLYLFGAHIFSQFLIAFGLDTSKIKFILDNSDSKHNKRLYGTKFEIRSPQVMKQDLSPVVILKAGVYNNEIMEDILSNINSSAIFLE